MTRQHHINAQLASAYTQQNNALRELVIARERHDIAQAAYAVANRLIMRLRAEDGTAAVHTTRRAVLPV